MCVGDDEAQEGYFCTVFGFKMNILIAVDDGLEVDDCEAAHRVGCSSSRGCCVCIVAAVAEAALRLASASP